MKKIKLILMALIIFAVLHVITLFALSDAKIFPCKISSVGGNMQMSEWRDGMCGVNYKYWLGSVQKLTLGASAARIGLIYVLPILITFLIMYSLHIRKKRAGTIIQQ